MKALATITLLLATTITQAASIDYSDERSLRTRAIELLSTNNNRYTEDECKFSYLAIRKTPFTSSVFFAQCSRKVEGHGSETITEQSRPVYIDENGFHFFLRPNR